ncbi:MAG TPA: CHRD domain-containing protein [Candidatus Saccharimonadales bacterium]|nr:CHRD domain-containing protein [Candidatus Saccharimonadales bacterium]
MKQFVALVAVAVLLSLPATVSGASDEMFTGTLSGAAQVPPVVTAATGPVYAVINGTADQIRWGVQYSGLSGPLTEAHIHFGAAGVNGQVMFPLTIGPSPMLGVLTAADFQAGASVTTWAAALDAIRAGTAYINLHTAAHPAGEIRAQLVSAAAASPSPSPTASATPHPAATPTASTVAVTTPPLQTPPVTLPPTSALAPLDRRDANIDLAPVLALLALGMLGGLLATWKVRPMRRGSVEDDD